jgi:putative DNA primase/helicase
MTDQQPEPQHDEVPTDDIDLTTDALRDWVRFMDREPNEDAVIDINDSSVVRSIDERYRAVPSDLRLAGRNLPGHNEPDAVADVIVNMLARLGWHLKWWRDELFTYAPHTNGAYVPLNQVDDEKSLSSAIFQSLKHAQRTTGNGDVVPWRPTPRVVDSVTESVKMQSMIDDTYEPGMWFNQRAMSDACDDVDARWPGSGAGDLLLDALSDELVNCRSGILWCPPPGPTGRRRRVLLPHSPGFFSTTSVAAEYDPEAGDGWGGRGEPSRWLQFLDELWPGDDEQRELLREWFGYVLSGRTDLQKMLVMIGPPRSGKGVIAHVLTRLLGGERRVHSTTLQQLNERFSMANAVGKPLMLIPDARVSSSTKIIVERLLSITGEDPISIDRKYKKPIEERLPCRIMLMSNEMPSLRDASQALASRVLPMRMEHSFRGREDPRLKSRLDDELTGILHWALEGMDKLRPENARFTMGRVAARELRSVEDDMAPVIAFIRATCVIEEGAWVPCDNLWHAWVAWVEEHGTNINVTKHRFGAELNASGLGIERVRPVIGGQRMYVYRGLRVKTWDESQAD